MLTEAYRSGRNEFQQDMVVGQEKRVKGANIGSKAIKPILRSVPQPLRVANTRIRWLGKLKLLLPTK